jgi:integrase
MPRGKSLKPPSYRLHKARGLAVVTIDDRDHYLGKYGSEESHRLYAKLLAEWRQRRGIPQPTSASGDYVIAELTLAYWQHAQPYYSTNGNANGRTAVVRSALRAVNACYASTQVDSFGPLKLQAVREALVGRGLSRRYVNELVNTIKRMFKWGVAQEIVPEPVWSTLKAVEGLRKGKTEAHEPDGVEPVEEEIVNATLPYLPPVVRAMVQMQLLTGARPGEVCSMRPCDVTFQTNGVWCYRPEHHKTEHKGKERRVYIGPKAQEILRPFLDRDPEAFCFSPAESEAERNAERRASRKTPMTPAQRKRRKKRVRKRSPAKRYTKDSYRRAIARACEIAFGMPDRLRRISRTVPAEEQKRLKIAAREWRAKHCWSPHRLRHSRATIVRERFGIEAAQVVLGHSDPRITQVYAERNFELAASVMREIG